MTSNFENAINEKDEIIASQNETINSYSGSECVSHVRLKKNNDDIFRIKPKKKGNAKSIEVDALKCEYPECEYNGNVDLIKCNACGKWVCEECNDIAVSKTIMNKCHTLYFVCKSCDVVILDDSTMSRDLKTTNGVEKESLPQAEKMENSYLLKSLQTMFDTKFIHIESKLEELIDNKLSKKMDENNTLMENTKERNHASPTTSLEEKSYSDALKDPKDFRQIMHEAINEERIEEREKGKKMQ